MVGDEHHDADAPFVTAGYRALVSLWSGEELNPGRYAVSPLASGRAQ